MKQYRDFAHSLLPMPYKARRSLLIESAFHFVSCHGSQGKQKSCTPSKARSSLLIKSAFLSWQSQRRRDRQAKQARVLDSHRFLDARGFAGMTQDAETRSKSVSVFGRLAFQASNFIDMKIASGSCHLGLTFLCLYGFMCMCVCGFLSH